MEVLKRNNVMVSGDGDHVMMFAHGFGCDQNMWRHVYPSFQEKYKIVLFDHVGAGNSDLSAYCYEKYDRLEGYAEDIVAIAKVLNISEGVFVGHSVSAIMGLIAANMAPGVFKTLILVAPSPAYINKEDYIGGFSKSEIDELLESLNNNHLGWSMAMGPVIMGNPDKKNLEKNWLTAFAKRTQK